MHWNETLASYANTRGPHLRFWVWESCQILLVPVEIITWRGLRTRTPWRLWQSDANHQYYEHRFDMMPKQSFYENLFAAEFPPGHYSSSPIVDNVPGCVCVFGTVSYTSEHACELTSQGHEQTCAWPRALAAITYFRCASPKWLPEPPSSPGQRQEVSWEKRRKQKQLSLAAGSDPEPWPSTSPSISLTTHTTDKTQMCKQGGVACNLPISKKVCLVPLSWN